MKILLDLNLNKKITMIMVTHDVSLKTFAQRVVRMADGKINKIEDIDPRTRDDMVKHLNDRFDAIHKGEIKDTLLYASCVLVTAWSVYEGFNV